MRRHWRRGLVRQPLDGDAVRQIQPGAAHAARDPDVGIPHPLTAEIYIISHRGSLLVILKPDGKLRDAILLNERFFHQPEGITFAPNGDLYISNEAVDKKANILKFGYRR